MVCYITSYFDIGRDKWFTFKRTFDDYLKHFLPFLQLFKKDRCEEDEMIVYIDDRYYEKMLSVINYKEVNIRLIKINEEFLNELHCWKTLEKETEIMNKSSFRKLLGSRVIYPEHNYPKYTMINHIKIDLVCKTITDNLSNESIYCWVDFGFFSKEENIPYRLLDISKFDLNCVNYTLINPIEKRDNDIFYTLKEAPEKIGGFFFLGVKEKLFEYQELYHTILNNFQNMYEIADDDQHVALQCYFHHPSLFSFNTKNFGWHKVLKANQKNPLKVISFCLWGKESRYTIGLLRNIRLAKIYYPEWMCWVYLHKPSIDIRLLDDLEKFDNVRVIIKEDLNIRPKRFMLWRFEPITDTSVEYFMSRDIDTKIQPREVLAVEEWLESGKTLHIMRDHPQHYPKILGGMYGIKCFKLFGEDWIDKIENFYKDNGEETDDQYFLYQYIYENEKTRKDRIIHDEIKRYEGDECREFPIKYEKNGNFVGCYIYEDDKPDEQTETVLKNYLNHVLPNRISEDDITFEQKLFCLKKLINTTYILHYTKLVDRKENLIKELKRNLLDRFLNIRWVDNFDREYITVDEIKKNCIMNPMILNRFMTLGEIANAMGHRYILREIAKNNEIALVLEDDTMFKKDFVQHLFYVLIHLPKNWEMICLGGPTEVQTKPLTTLPISTKMDFENKEMVFYKPASPAPCTLSCMLMNYVGVNKVLTSTYIEPLCAPSDHTMWACCIERKVDMIWVQPWITYEASKTDKFQTSLDRGY